MRSTIAKITFGMVFTVLSLNSQLVSQGSDLSGKVVIAGPHLQTSPMTVN